jgi:hypothetical protein
VDGGCAIGPARSVVFKPRCDHLAYSPKELLSKQAVSTRGQAKRKGVR